jgi:hypothetical protein
MRSALDLFLRRFITVGRLTVQWPDGEIKTYVGSGRSGPEAGVVLRDRRTVRRLVLNPEMAVGEAYMDGGLAPLDGTIDRVLSVVLANLRANRRIASSEMLPKARALPHLKCSPGDGLGDDYEEGEHGDTPGIGGGDH